MKSTNIGQYFPCPNLCGYICCSLFESAAYIGWSLVSTIVCPGFNKVVTESTILIQYFCVPKSATFCLSNGKIELKYGTISALFLLEVYTDQEVSGTNSLKLATCFNQSNSFFLSSVRTVELALSGMFTVETGDKIFQEDLWPLQISCKRKAILSPFYCLLMKH